MERAADLNQAPVLAQFEQDLGACERGCSCDPCQSPSGLSTSPALRTWFGHDPARYEEFRRRYLAELAEEPGKSALALLRERIAQGPVTLVFAAQDAEHCNASVLRDLLAKSADR